MTKVYVITGAASGIGRALTEALAQKDTKIFASYRSDGGEVSLRNISDNVIPFYVDYSKPETIPAAIELIKSKTERVDTLINAIGCVVAGPVEKISVNEIRRQFDVNVFGHLEFAFGLIDKMDGGKIINISSMASYGIFPFISPYCASKKCLDMFFNSLLIENKQNIKVVSIKPGVISTPLWGKSVEQNIQHLKDCGGFEREMEYVIKNARKNETNGLNVNEVVKVVLKADSSKKPKLSYTVGKDALFAKTVSKLPQVWINKLVKFGIKTRVSAIKKHQE